MISCEHTLTGTIENNTLNISCNVNTDPKIPNIECNLSIGRGEPGLPGHTPVKGVDYFTEEDIKYLDIDGKVQEALNFSVEELLADLNKKIDEVNMNIPRLDKKDQDLEEKLRQVIQKMDELARYSKGEIHGVIIY